jgi:ABC-type nitrate/sulfonate/bicarbonate transport system permease component
MKWVVLLPISNSINMYLLQPFSEVSKRTTKLIYGAWALLLMFIWALVSITGTTHIFPTIPQVLSAFGSMYNEGLITHVFSSLSLCFISVIIASFISILIGYSSKITGLKPISEMISKFRFLPLVGISFYVGIVIEDGRAIQIGVLVIFMMTYLITSILGMINDIPEKEYDHARTLGCTKWEMLWEVVIIGRIDYVIEAIRQNLAIVWMMLVTVESIMISSGGIGVLIKNSDKAGAGGRMAALQIIIVLIGMFYDLIVNKVRKIGFRYSKF